MLRVHISPLCKEAMLNKPYICLASCTLCIDLTTPCILCDQSILKSARKKFEAHKKLAAKKASQESKPAAHKSSSPECVPSQFLSFQTNA